MIPLRDANPTRRTPIVTLAIIAACILVFLYQLSLESESRAALERFIVHWGVVPAELVKALGAGHVVSQEAATLLSSQFLHGGLIHIGGNLLFLWIFGNNVEDRFGRLRFLAFYLVGGIVAALAQVAVDPSSTVPTIGASGAIAAVLGAYLILYPGARVTTAIFLVFFYQLIDVPAIVVLVLWFVLQLFDGIASLGITASAGGVAVFAHIGGFIFGALIAIVVRAVGGAAAGGSGPGSRWSVG